MSQSFFCRTPNEPTNILTRHAIMHEGCWPTNDGALCAWTGDPDCWTGLERTGRSPKDRYFVAHSEVRDKINWNKLNVPFESKPFEKIWKEALEHAAGLKHPLFCSNDLWIGTHSKYQIPIQPFTKYAWHQLFIRTMIPKGRIHTAQDNPWALLNLPSFHVDPKEYGTNSEDGLWIDFVQRRILAAGLKYAGENKKAGFVVANYDFPARNVFTMHCSVVVTETGKVVWIFGLSGTGKTTHAMSERHWVVGDDMFLYSLDDGQTCQLEDGCYPSVLNLSREREPIIHRAVNQSGAILENVVLRDGRPDFDDPRYTQNVRAAFPLSHIGDKRIPGGKVSKPDFIIFLECDAYGVRPPVSVLRSPEQAAYYYLSGYTSQVGRTVVGSTHAFAPVHSMAYGEDFFPGYPVEYLNLFRMVLHQTGATVAIVNTGWTGGSADDLISGRRLSIPTSRITLDVVIDGVVRADTESEYVPEWNLWIPTHIPGVEDRNRDPRIIWKGRETQYQELCRELQMAFAKNWDAKFAEVSRSIRDAGPPRP